MDKQGMHAVQVGALVPEFEKSAPGLKPTPKLLKCKNT